jgi:bifunctional ADP-heptose synthase (sugar kinase/adenylyltransferase)
LTLFALQLAGVSDTSRSDGPLSDEQLMMVAARLHGNISPTILLDYARRKGHVALREREKTVHIPTVAQQVFDVSGTGDTVIAAFTAAVAAGA